MSYSQNPKTAEDEVPKLSQIAILRVAQLIANEELPSFDYQVVASLSQSIFEELRCKQDLSFKAMRTMCTKKRFLIDRIDLTDNNIQKKHLKLCSKLNLISFQLGNLETVYDETWVPKVLRVALNQTSRRQLRHLGLNGMGILNETWPKSVAQKLPSLESLSFDGRPTTNLTFALIGSNLSQLRFLSMSNTNVTDISCISGLKNLEVLILYNLEITNGNIDALAQLSKLRVLDISRSFMGSRQNLIHPTHFQLAKGIYDKSVESILNGTPTPWPELRAVNLSGLGIDQFARSNADPVETIIMAHPKLEQIGLFDILLDPEEVAQVNGRKVQIISQGSGKSLNYALSHYLHLDREGEVWRVLRTIRTRLETQYNTYSVKDLQECLHLMCSMIFNQMPFDIEASYCLFEICRERIVTTLSVRQRNNVINRCLDSISFNFYTLAFEAGMNHLFLKLWQLINKLLLCTNKSDYKRLLDIALMAIYHNTNEEIERSILKALAIVTSKMPVPENGTLPDETHISNLYRLLKKYLEACCLHVRTENDIDVETALNTLRDTLTILSELNLHSLVPCQVFLDANGFDVAVRILEEVEDIIAHIAILKIILFFIEFGKAKLCKSKVITLLLSCVDCDFKGTDKVKLYQKEEKSYIAASILFKLLTNSSRLWESNQQKTEVSEMLLRTTIQYAGLYRPRISFSSCFLWNSVLHFARYNGEIMWILWSLLYLLQHDKHEFLTLKHSGIYEYCADSCLELFSLIQDIADGHKTLGNRYSKTIEKVDHRVIEMAKKIIALVDEDVVKIFTISNCSEDNCATIKILTNEN